MEDENYDILEDGNFGVVYWDYKEQPPWDDINDLMQRVGDTLGGTPEIHPVVTGDDSYCVIVSFEGYVEAQTDTPQEFYEMYLEAIEKSEDYG